ncbi:hypothetical protein AaE_011533 [Aphanomyces astaci]|uniref:CBM1 domain-containing protein n=1 Tax=Aphanomyces astaci TaxID=112090 RepID=A0A6A4ZII2_APHAT|nr:hypothetical protein AaE_011533 [Aphanomyces astaci]
MKSTAFLTPMALIMTTMVQDASAECGTCTNCYYPPTGACFQWFSKEQCDSHGFYKWCGSGGSDPLPSPSSGPKPSSDPEPSTPSSDNPFDCV